MHGLAVTTVEGIGNIRNIHPVQERIAKFHGTQCGFCTPGMVMSMYTLLRNNPTPTMKELEEYFDGNLCRCTGYRGILDGFRTFTKEFTCQLGRQCCRNNETNGCCPPSDVNDQISSDGELTGGYNVLQLEVLGPKLSTLKPHLPSQEPIFPPDLKVNHGQYLGDVIRFGNSDTAWILPNTLEQLLELKSQYPDAKLVVGNTEIGIDVKFKFHTFPVLISITNVKELSVVQLTEDGLVIGGAVTLSELALKLHDVIATEPKYKTGIFSAFFEMLKWFGSHQIRNVASLAGNLITASPISDLNPLLLASEASVKLQSHGRGPRILTINREFFTEYRQTSLARGEVVVWVTIPFTKKGQFFSGFKQGIRKEDDISIVNAGMMVELNDDKVINKITLAFGGMGQTVVLASETMETLLGNQWDDSLYPRACEYLARDLPLDPGTPGGSEEYRRTLALSFFKKFYTSVNNELHMDQIPSEISAIQPLESPITKATQVIGAVDSRDQSLYPVGRPEAHLSALQHSTGEAQYIDDMPPLDGELYLSLVTSTKPFAKILSIDPSAALASVGVVDFIGAADVPNKNNLGIVMYKVFEDTEVTCQGQVIGAVVATTHEYARNAARLVQIDYEPKTPIIITTKEAIRNNSYFPAHKEIIIGDAEAGFKSSDHILEGEVRINGQNHFYLETMATRAIPGENGELEIFASSQCPADVQHSVATVLGLDINKVMVRTKRIGGGFGGKETQVLLSAAPTAVAASKLGKPVRCILERDEDMVTTGNRHPFLAKYKVGFTSEGKILSLDIEIYCNAGNSMDLSLAVLDKAMLLIDASYKFPNMRIVGKACKTNIMSNTAFRSFGGIQGQWIVECIIDDVVAFRSLDPVQVRSANFYHPGDLTHFNFPAGSENLKACWDMCLEKSNYYMKCEEVNEYNRNNRWKKKGISIVPTVFGIGFLLEHLNQAGALVNVYKDGSVLIAHSGVEMGQGLYVKIAQIASRILGIPLSKIQIRETSTNTVPNSAPTAASLSTDLNGMAVKNACLTLLKRLQPIRDAKPNDTWEQWIESAYLARISLSATGFYRTPNIGYNMADRSGNPWSYFTYGAACSVVQIDCLTGDHKILSTDIVMDIGKSINPAIDVGQIEGAFIQGCGLMLLEDIKVNPEGGHRTTGPGTYKIPAFGNIPAEFNVSLVPDSENPNTIFYSRAVGEPPLLLASSVFFAVKDAIRAARRDNEESPRFTLNCPALPANIRMTCSDDLSKKFPEAVEGTYVPWTSIIFFFFQITYLHTYKYVFICLNNYSNIYNM
ncbi:hypothetical protein Btru_072338 [Bulinus truncatus]|nr:hypothetical protein Btru_072338 [Bulinus truncatus]